MRFRNQARWVETALLALVLLVAPSAGARDKTDIVTLKNGDRVTGEIKKLELGQISLSTDAMRTVTLDWVYVKKIESTQLFEVENEDGAKYYGFITPADEQGRFVVLGPNGPVASLDHDRIVKIDALEETWRDRWRGFVDLGFSYTSANSSTQLSLSAESTYRTKKFLWTNSATSISSSITADLDEGEEAVRSKWTTLNSDLQRFLKNRWFWGGYTRYEQNDEIGLDARSTIGSGIGRYLVQTSRSQLSGLVGLAGSRETYLGEETPGEKPPREGSSSDWTLEGLLNAKWDFFIFGDRETTLSVGLTLFPSLSTSGRYRAELDSSLRREFFTDFTLALTFFGTYDSNPPPGSAEKNDMRFVTSLGWKF